MRGIFRLKQKSDLFRVTSTRALLLTASCCLLLLILNSADIQAGRTRIPTDKSSLITRKPELIFYFYPGADLADKKTVTINIGLKGLGNYELEVITIEEGARRKRIRCDYDDDVIGLRLEVSACLPTVVKFYSVQGEQEKARPLKLVADKVSVNDCLWSDRPLNIENAESAESHPYIFSSPEERRHAISRLKHLRPRIISDDARPDHSKCVLDDVEDLVLEGRTLRQIQVSKSVLTANVVTSTFNSLTKTGRLLLYHLLGGDMRLSCGFKVSGLILDQALLHECQMLAYTGAFSSRHITRICNRLDWLCSSHFAEAEVPACPENNCSETNPAESHPEYQDDTNASLHELYLRYITNQEFQPAKEYPVLVWALKHMLQNDSTRLNAAGEFDTSVGKGSVSFRKLLGSIIYMLTDATSWQKTAITDSSTCFRATKKAFEMAELGAVEHTAFVSAFNNYQVMLQEPKVGSQPDDHESSRPPLSMQVVLLEASPQRPVNRTLHIPSRAEILHRLVFKCQAMTLQNTEKCSGFKGVTQQIELGYLSTAGALPDIPHPPFPRPNTVPVTDYAVNPGLGMSIPSRFIRDYCPLKLLGGGGEAECYLVKLRGNAIPQALSAGRPYVLKLSSGAKARKTDDYGETSLITINALHHPYGVEVHTQRQLTQPKSKFSVTGTTRREKIFWYTQLQQFCPGGNLHQWLKQQGRLSEYQCWAVTVQLMDYLQSLHSRQIAHRDIKPDNIFIDEKGFIRVGDFGLTRFYLCSREMVTEPYVGTAYYSGAACIRSADKEQIQFSPFAIDIHSLGMTLFQLSAGVMFYDPSGLKNSKLKLYALIEYLQFICQFPDFDRAVSKLKVELRARYNDMEIPCTHHLLDFMARLMCSHLSSPTDDRSLLTLYTHPYLYQISAIMPESGPPVAAAPDEPLAGVYRPELFLSDDNTRLRPTLIHTLTTAESGDRPRLSASAETKLRKHYFHQPLPTGFRTLKHAFLLGQLIQMARKSSRAETGADFITEKAARYHHYCDHEHICCQPLTELLDRLETGRAQGNTLKHLYEVILSDCSLTGISEQIDRAADVLWKMMQKKQGSENPSPDKSYCHIVDISNPGTIPDSCHDLVTLLKAGEDWSVLVPKKLTISESGESS